MAPLTVTSSPHIRTADSVPRIMWSVVAALAPALVASGYFFGWRAWFVTALSVATAVVAEAAVQKFRSRAVTVADGSAVVTGILVAFCMPATVRWFVPVVGSAAAILIAKHCFGGLGYNIWNPALVGRAIVHNCYPADMNPSQYPLVRLAEPGDGLLGRAADFFRHVAVNVGTGGAAAPPVDVITGASPLKVMKEIADGSPDVSVLAEHLPAQGFQAAGETFTRAVTLWDAFLGHVGGNLGEVSALLLVIGAIYLVARGTVRWHVPVLYVGTVALLAGVLPLKVAGPGGEAVWTWAAAFQAGGTAGWHYVGYHVLCGGLMLGALYMATDMVTSPLTGKGQAIFAVGCGVLTALIRLYGGYPEGVCYSILLMNTAVPLIDRWTRPRVFGQVAKKKPEAA